MAMQICLLSALIAASFSAAESQECGRYGPHAEENGEIDFKTNIAMPGEVPWTVMILTKYLLSTYELTPPTHLCNGALFHPAAVLVPDICLTHGVEKRGLIVVAGVWEIGSSQETLPTQERTVKWVERSNRTLPKLHQVHMPAILILSRPFELAENVGIICVPRPHDVYNKRRCIVSGWRGTLDDVAENDGKLKRLRVPIIPVKRCRRRYRKVYPPKDRFSLALNKRSMCVGSPRHPDMCFLGSPLVCPLVDDPSRWVLVGLSVDYVGCYNSEDPYVPSQYAVVPAVHAWIDDKMRDHELVL